MKELFVAPEYIDPEKFGTGIIDGIIASETTNNIDIVGDFAPLLTLGNSGNIVTDKWELRGQVLLTLN